MRTFFLLVATVLCFVVGVSRAETVETFDASGTFHSGSTLSGTMTLDVTTGVIQSIDVTADSLNFRFVQNTAMEWGNLWVITGEQFTGTPNFNFGMDPNVTTLVDYSGGWIASTYHSDSGVSDVVYSPTNYDYLVSGSFTEVPEPTLTCAVLCGMLLIRRRTIRA